MKTCQLPYKTTEHIILTTGLSIQLMSGCQERYILTENELLQAYFKSYLWYQNQPHGGGVLELWCQLCNLVEVMSSVLTGTVIICCVMRRGSN